MYLSPPSAAYGKQFTTAPPPQKLRGTYGGTIHYIQILLRYGLFASSTCIDNVRILAHFRIPALMEKDMGRAGYDFQSPDNEKPRLEGGTGPCPEKSYSSTGPCSRASSTHGAREGRADRQRDARRFRRTRSPTPRDTGVPADGRRIGPATTSGADRQGRQARAQGAEIEGRPVRSAVIERYRRRGKA